VIQQKTPLQHVFTAIPLQIEGVFLLLTGSDGQEDRTFLKRTERSLKSREDSVFFREHSLKNRKDFLFWKEHFLKNRENSLKNRENFLFLRERPFKNRE
jgi:hypothetical protein